MVVREKKYKKVLLVWAGLILIFLLVVLSLLIKQFTKVRKSIYRHIGRINFVITNGKEEIDLFSLEKDNVLVFNLQPKNNIVVTRGYGSYELGKVFSLGELENGKGGILLRETIQEQFHIPVLGYIFTGSYYARKENNKKTILNLLWNSFWGKIKSDIKREDMFIAWYKTLKVKKENFIEKEYFGEGDLLFSDKKVVEEALPIEILNSTEHNGLAQNSALLVENIGGRVVRVSDFPELFEKCQILTNKNQDNSSTVAVLEISFDCQVEKRREKEDRAEITLILGEDYWKKLSEKW